MLYERGRYEEALHAFEQVIVLKHDDVWAWYRKGNTLYRLKYYVDALEAYERVNGLDPHFADAYCDKGNALYQLERYKEALEAYEEVIKRARLPDRALVSKAWVGKARALKTLSDQALARAKELGVNLPPDWLFDLEL